MPLKPSSLYQLSVLSLSFCLSLQSYTWAEEQTSISPHLSTQNSLELADRSKAVPDHPLQQNDLQSLPFRLDSSAVSNPIEQQPQQSQAEDLQAELSLEQETLGEQNTASPKPISPPPVPLSPEDRGKDSISTPALQQYTAKPRGADAREMLAVPANPTLFSDRLAQFPEPPSQVEPAGRRPTVRIQPSNPDEAPLDLRQELLTPKRIYSPSITILTPSAYGKSWRQASVGFGVQHRTRFSNSADGAFGVGIGFGDAQKYVGLDVGLTLTDLQDFERAIISFKIHRQLPHLLAVAVGVNDAISIGDGDVDGPSPYGVVSKTFILKENTEELFSRVYLSAGAGTGRYRTESNVFTDSDTPGVFGSVALRVFDPMNVIAEWSGQDLSLGLSIRPFREIPLIITPAVTDITGTAGDGVRFIVGIGYAISF
ncbi:MAG: hypothetical protein HC934_11950 [Acaryochloridaceae cyanobacterium SU_2_1]|nr:hypothetical protein [Acaryochloridaceae cyanobacterium SU_2_1]NJM95624.1 hypothetical protein [Acaryochloridaceae cyanobacterium CSU_5_19]